MQRPNLNDLISFIAVARQRSFTRAAAKLGVSPSALSHTIRGLEEQLGLRLLTRTTRSVAPTAAGDRLLNALAPRFDEIEAELAALGALRDQPAGKIRLTADEVAMHTILWPKLRRMLPDYPEIEVELITDNALTDIVAERFDAGIRLGDIIAKDMIAVPIGPPIRMAVVAAPAYLARNPAPQTPQDLTTHTCINLRLPTYGGLYAWEFERPGKAIQVRVQGQLTFNSIGPMLEAALDGFGIAYLTQSQVQPHLDSGRLVRLLDEWCPPTPGFHIYYPSRRQPTAAFTLLIDALRHR
jgi:DNA-binding transcriptional LysR family regulator